MNDVDFIRACNAFGDENRLKIIKMLARGESCASDLLRELRITQPTLSHHMKILVESSLVCSTKEGKYIKYRLNTDKLTAFKWFVSRIER